jgi:predicted enzyme related to lactoylglutathione lyase
MNDNGVPLTTFAVDDIEAEHARLTAAGAAFKSPPSEGDAAMPKVATFDDTCGNWIMLYEPPH